MKIYTTKLNKYKRLDALSSNIVASTNENEVSFIRVYLDEWLDELEDFDKYIEIQRPDGEKYISQILTTQIDYKGMYIELPITSQLCCLDGTYLFDFCAIQEVDDKKYVFKSINLCSYEINDSINALVGMSDEDVNLLTDFVDSYCDKYVDENFYSQETLTNMFADKVDKIDGKGLSTNDYTDTDKLLVHSALQAHQDISGKADKTELPTKTSDLTNNSGYITIDDIPNDAVSSVNGKTGAVVLNASDVGAVATETGKGLSTNDFTNKMKSKLENISVSTTLLEDGTYNFIVEGGNE